MDSIEHVSKLIKVIFDGSNYDIWAQEMCSFLKGRILWRIVTEKILKPVQKKDEDEENFIEWLDQWDGMNHPILTWFRNTCANVMKLDLCWFDTTKEV